MFKGTVNNVTSSTDTNITVTPIMNTNRNVTYDSTNNVIIFNSPGYYDITANITVTDISPGTITLTEYINGVASDNAKSSTVVVATSDSNTLIVTDVIHVIPSMLSSNKANVSFQLNEAGTIESGIVLVEGRK